MNRLQFRHIVETQGVLCTFASLLAALTQFRLIVTIMGPRYGMSVDAAQGVVNGLPHWRVFQSRVFGPWSVEALSWLTGNFLAAHVIYTIGLYFLAGLAILYVAYRLFGSKSAWMCFFAFHFLCVLLTNHMWFYAWDSGELLTFILFCYFVLSGKDWRWMTGLFAVSIFNRESAFFIAAWMVLDPLLTSFLDRTRPRVTPMIAAGLACLVAGGAVIHVLRDWLLVKEIGPELFGMPEKAGLAFQSNLGDNLQFMASAFTHPTPEFHILLVLLLLSPLALTVFLYRRFGRRYLSLGLTHILIALTLPVVGMLSEQRVMFDLAPFLCLGLTALCFDERTTKA